MPVVYVLSIFLVLLIFKDNAWCQSSDTSSIFPNISGMLQPGGCSIVAQYIVNQAVSGITLRFHYGLKDEDVYEVPLNQSTSILDHPQFNMSSPMVVYMTGWLQTVDNEQTLKIISEFVKYCDCNFIMVNWTSVSTNFLYNAAVSMTPAAGSAIASSLDDMIDAGATLDYLVGISLGGQAIGHVSRNMKNRVKHLVAMDPAGPLFYLPLQCVLPISQADAECVEVIHTDRGRLGAPVRTGTVDYWVNGGSGTQPGCEMIPGCSHTRSQELFIEVLRDPESMPARQCNSWLTFLLNGCANNNIINFIGQCNNESIPGDYYLRTSGTRPYGLRLRGALSVLARA